MKKILALLLIGGIVMTTLTGCKDVIFGKSRDEIEDLFVDFMSVFQAEDYDFLYEKEGHTENLPEGDEGCWVLSTNMYIYEGDERSRKGIQLVFNKNTNQCRGYFRLDDDKYIISYENGEILLTDDYADEIVKNELSNFPFLFDVISVDKSYLNTLKCKRDYYNFEVPLYGADYYLPEDDVNRIALKNNYPNSPYHDAEEVFLKLTGDGSVQWNTTSNRELYAYYKTEAGRTSFSASVTFGGIDFFSGLFEEE